MRPRGLARVIEDWRQGRRFGYPLCCILHFCWDGLVGWPSGVVRWRQIEHTRGERWVPCGLFHGADSPHPFSVRACRILDFNLRHLAPTQEGRMRHVVALRGSARWRVAEPELKVWASRHGQLERLYWGGPPLDRALRRRNGAPVQGVTGAGQGVRV